MTQSDFISLMPGQYLAPKCHRFDYNKIQICLTEYPHYQKTGDWHHHKNAMVSFVMQGGNVESRRQTNLERLPGSLNFYHAGEPHKNIYKVFPSKHLSLEVDQSFLDDHCLTEVRLASAMINNPNSKFILLNILNEAIQHDRYTDSVIQSLFLSIVQPLQTLSKAPPNWLKQVKSLLENQWNEWPSLAQLSDSVNVHPVTISSLFNHYYHVTISDFLRILKVEHAIQMIQNSEKPLTEIALECGFSDQSHFTRVFKSKTGFLPARYRRV